MDTNHSRNWYGYCIYAGNRLNGKNGPRVPKALKSGNFPEESQEEREVEKMVWIMVALVLALCAFFMMCVLTLGKRADQRKELLFGVCPPGLQEADAFTPLPRGTGVLC